MHQPSRPTSLLSGSSLTEPKPSDTVGTLNTPRAYHAYWGQALTRARTALQYAGPTPSLELAESGVALRVRSFPAMIYEAPRVEISVGRQLAVAELNHSTRELLLAHELGHLELWQSPRRALYRCGFLRGTVQEERDVNQIVYIAYARIYGAPEAQRLIRQSMSEFLDLQPGTSATATDRHIERYSPALLLDSPPRLWMGGAKWGRV